MACKALRRQYKKGDVTSTYTRDKITRKDSRKWWLEADVTATSFARVIGGINLQYESLA